MFVALVLMCLGLWASNPDFLGQSNVLNTTRTSDTGKLLRGKPETMKS